MLNRRSLLAGAAALALAAFPPGLASAQDNARNKMSVVATFSILADMVERVGGEHVSVATLVPRSGDAHVYQPTPADARAVREARLLFVNGLQFEGWLDRLVEASEFQGVRVVVTDGVEVMKAGQGRLPARDGEHGHGHAEAGHEDQDHDDQDHDEHADGQGHHDHGHHDHGAFDPHAWMSLANAIVYVNNIAIALAEADPANAADYWRNRSGYIAEIKTLDASIRETVEAVPAERRVIVTSHNAFQYFGRAYGLTFLAPQGISTESEASAKAIAHLIGQIRERGIEALFLEGVADPRLLETIADETDVVIGGTLYSDALTERDGAAPSYLELMRHNATTIAAALSV